MKKFRGVALQPKLSPQENVDRIFEQARKAERAGPILRNRLAELEALVCRTSNPADAIPSQIQIRPKGEKAAPASALPCLLESRPAPHPRREGRARQRRDDDARGRTP